MNSKTENQCARCGSCTVVCPVFRVTGRETVTARGKLHLLSTDLAEGPSRHFQDIFSQCLLCGACEDVCSRQLPVRKQIVVARSSFSRLYGRHPLQRELVRQALANSPLLEGLVKAGLKLSNLSVLPDDSGLRIKLGLLENGVAAEQHRPEETPATDQQRSSELTYFSGCMARYLQPSIGLATGRLAEKLTGDLPHEPNSQVCCGLASLSAGRREEAKKLARKNIEVFAQSSGQILTSCSSCSSHLKTYPALFEDDPGWHEKAVKFSNRVIEFTAFVKQGVEADNLEATQACPVFYHEPCHLRYGHGKSESASKFLDTLTGLTMVSSDEKHHCCGQGGLFHLGYPELSREIFSQACDRPFLEEVELVVTTCSGCLMQWQSGLAKRKSPVKAVHLALLLR